MLLTEIQIYSLIGRNQFDSSSSWIEESKCTLPNVLFAVAPTFWRSDFPGFSRIFRKLEVKAANCRAFRFSILGELDGVTVTQRVEPTAAAKLPSPVTMESFLPGARKGEESEEKRKRRIACVFRSIWYFFHNAYTVDFFAVIVTCTCHPRLFNAARTFNLHWMSLKSRASIYWVFSSVKIFHRTCLSRRQEAVHRQAFSERRCITVQRDIIRNSPALKIFFSHLKENTSLQATWSTSFYKKKLRTNDAI